VRTVPVPYSHAHHGQCWRRLLRHAGISGALRVRPSLVSVSWYPRRCCRVPCSSKPGWQRVENPMLLLLMWPVDARSIEDSLNVAMDSGYTIGASFPVGSLLRQKATNLPQFRSMACTETSGSVVMEADGMLTGMFLYPTTGGGVLRNSPRLIGFGLGSRRGWTRPRAVSCSSARRRELPRRRLRRRGGGSRRWRHSPPWTVVGSSRRHLVRSEALHLFEVSTRRLSWLRLRELLGTHGRSESSLIPSKACECSI